MRRREMSFGGCLFLLDEGIFRPHRRCTSSYLYETPGGGVGTLSPVHLQGVLRRYLMRKGERVQGWAVMCTTLSCGFCIAWEASYTHLPTVVV